MPMPPPPPPPQLPSILPFLRRLKPVSAASKPVFSFFYSSSSSPLFEPEKDHLQHNSHLQKTQHFSNLLHSNSHSKTTQFPQLHTQFIRNHYFHYPNISIKFLSVTSSLFPHNISYVRKVFDLIPDPGRYHYNVMIRGYSRSEVSDNGLMLYKKMKEEEVVVSDGVTFSGLLKCCAKKTGLIEGMQVHRRVLGDGYVGDCVLMTNLLEVYAVCGKTEDACKVFDEMSVRDTFAYNALVSCFLDKMSRDSLAVFDSMLSLRSECRPDTVTCLLLLRACAHLGALDFGKRVHEYIEKYGYSHFVNVNNTLITMYSSCGDIDEAYKIFEKMRVKNLVSYSTMISGFGMNGFGKDGLKLFWQMQKTGISPDDKALTAVLYACSQSGLLHEGFELFDNMTKEFGILPNTHHYGCAIDILGRLGLLEKAYEFILSMPVKPDAKMWRTLLGACRVYKAFDLAEKVVEHIVEIKAIEAGDYILLLNTYSSNQKWDKVTNLRMFLRENKIMAIPGCCSIEMKGVVHEFVAGDVKHPRKDEIYKMVDEILKQLKMGGYVSQAECELRDLNASEKEKALCYHSEMLAVAFGVILTPPGMTIRVASSVRVGVDCHEFGKAFSAVYDRKLIICDRNRIHLFRKGHCSCCDCW